MAPLKGVLHLPGVQGAEHQPPVVLVHEGVGVAAVAQQVDEALERDGVELTNDHLRKNF